MKLNGLKKQLDEGFKEKDEEIAKIKIVMQKAEELGIKLDKSTEEKLKEQSTSKESEALCQYYGITNDELLKILEESKINIFENMSTFS